MLMHTAHSNIKGIYATNWLNVLPTLLPVSHHFWSVTTIPWNLKLQTHKARWGRLWNKKLAYRWGKPYGTCPTPATSDMCPICRETQDGASHILAGCKAFKGHYIARHDKAVQLIGKGVSKGSLGGHKLVMDAGAEAKLPPGVSKQLPQQLRPPHLTPLQWTKYRPDLAIIPQQYLLPGAIPDGFHPIHLVEVGYCSDTRHETKAAHKREQHAALINLLKQQGYKVDLTTITLGTTGTIPTHTYSDLVDLGMDNTSVDRLLIKLHINSINYLGHIVKERRQRESKTPHDHG